MGLYTSFIEPAVVSFACSLPAIMRERAKIVPEASGVVLEIGFGSGHNASLYNTAIIEKLIALEPSAEMRRRAAKRVAAFNAPFEWLDLSAEEIPLASASVDTAVSTFTLCTIPDVGRALTSLRRVLKPGGRFLFLEHGAAPDPAVRRFQDRLDPVWGRFAGGCHLNRDPGALVRGAGFELVQSFGRYAKAAPKFAGFLTSGVAIA
ncbi:MAG: class I SAM-dependent methyltransferase [Parvularculaceae bacterium]|nr:class I SAM-dependent methyltransferase [Parvularculaceae bacterium]